MNKNIQFFTDFIFDVSDNPSTLKHLSKYYLTKALKKFFHNIQSGGVILGDTQIIGIIFKIKFSDGSIKSISTLKKGYITSITKFSTLFKHLLNLRHENYNS